MRRFQSRVSELTAERKTVMERHQRSADIDAQRQKSTGE